MLSMVLLIVGNVPINNETPMITSSISSREFAGPELKGAHKGKICMRSQQ